MSKERRLTKTDMQIVQILLRACAKIPILDPVVISHLNITPQNRVGVYRIFSSPRPGFIINGLVSGRMMHARCVKFSKNEVWVLLIEFPNIPRCNTVTRVEWYFQIRWAKTIHGLVPVVTYIET